MSHAPTNLYGLYDIVSVSGIEFGTVRTKRKISVDQEHHQINVRASKLFEDEQVSSRHVGRPCSEPLVPRGKQLRRRVLMLCIQ